MIIPGQPFTIPRVQRDTLMYSVFCIGTCTLIAAAFAAVLAVVYLLALAQSRAWPGVALISTPIPLAACSC